MELKEAKTVLECLLFVSDKPLSLAVFKSLLEDMDRRDIIQCLDELKAEYDAQGRAFHLVEIAEGYQLVTRVALAPWIRKLYKNRTGNKLSRAALETMAIVAYRQPISKAEIEDIRGVSADGVLNSLLERKLVRVVGRKEVIGRPLLYGTTKEFLHYFGLKDLSDMPELKDLQDMLRSDDAGEDWELNAEGNLIAKVKSKDELEFAAEPTTDHGVATPSQEAPGISNDKILEVTMQPYTEPNLNPGETPGAVPGLAEASLEAEALAPETATAAPRRWKDDYEGGFGEDEEVDDDEEKEEDEDEDDPLGLDEDDDSDDEDEDEDDEDDDEDDGDDEDDEDDEDDGDEDDLGDLDEDDEDEGDEDDDEDDNEEDDEEDDEDEDDDEDLDDIDDLGSEESGEDKPSRGKGGRKGYYN
jgi:segregation and condensation protein B